MGGNSFGLELTSEVIGSKEQSAPLFNISHQHPPKAAHLAEVLEKPSDFMCHSFQVSRPSVDPVHVAERSHFDGTFPAAGPIPALISIMVILPFLSAVSCPG